MEEQKRLENSPVWLVASDILNSDITGVMPLHIFFAPPKLQFERFANVTNNNKGFPDLELTLAEGLRQFFKEYGQQKRPLDFLAGAWVSKTFHSEASIKALFGVLKSEPTLVLESEIDGDYLNFRVAYWGLNWSNFRYDPIISRLPYRNILYDAAKNRAKKWLETREKLIATGENAEEVDKIYGADNVQNLAILQKEEKFRNSGISSKDLELHYRVNNKDFEDLGQFFILYHCVFSGLLADEYFLIEYNLPPSLPQLLPNLINEINDTETLKELIKSIVFYYEKMYDVLGQDQERSALVPDLSLDLALGLANLADKIWGKGQIIYSLKHWLRLHDIEVPNDFESLLTTVTSVLTIDDINYVNKLNQCLQAINDNHDLSVKDACYQRGVHRSKNEEYKQAIADFDQAIELNSQWADAYYNRGLTYMKLEQTQKAIHDYTEALEINPNWDLAHCNRGNAYYKLGKYEQAILDYDSALRINPNYGQAQRNKDVVQGVWDEVKRQRQQKQVSSMDKKKKLENVVLISTISGHSDGVMSVVFSSDNETLCSAGSDDTIKIWDLITEKPKVSYRDQTNICSLAFVPNSQILVSGNDCKIKLWNLSIPKKDKTLIDDFNESIYALAISDNGQILASGGDSGYILIWDLNTGKQINTLTLNFYPVNSIVISNDSQILAVSGNNEEIVIYDLSTQEEINTLVGHGDSVNTLLISDESTLISGSDDTTIKFWNIETGEEIRTLTGHDYSVEVLAISPDGKRLISGDFDGNIIVWNLDDKIAFCDPIRGFYNPTKLQQFSAHSGVVSTLAISPDGYTLVSGGADNLIKIWRVQE